MGAHLTVEQRQLALRLKARGLSLREIGPQVGCVFQTVARIAGRHNLGKLTPPHRRVRTIMVSLRAVRRPLRDAYGVRDPLPCRLKPGPHCPEPVNGIEPMTCR